MPKKYFYDDDVIDDVTVWPQSQLSMFLYKWNNNIFHDNSKTSNILQVHCWGCLVVLVMFHVLVTSLMTSPGHKISQILKLTYLHQYLRYSIDKKLKISEMLVAIFLVYSTCGITSGEKVCHELEMAAILKLWKYNTQLWFDLRYKKNVPNFAKKVFLWWWRHRWRPSVISKSALYIPL